MADNNQKTVCYVLIGIVVLVILYFCFMKKKGSPTDKYSHKDDDKIEPFTSLSAGANDNTGMLLDDAYDLITGADHEVPAQNFADMIPEHDYTKNYVQEKKEGPNLRSMERLHRVQGKSLMPRTSTSVTPFNIDISNPSAYQYAVNTPRVSSALKSRFKDYSLANFLRGDVLIQYDPNVPLISKTIQGRSDVRHDGFFSNGFNAKFNKYTGKGFKNLVQKVSNGETIMDHY